MSVVMSRHVLFFAAGSTKVLTIHTVASERLAAGTARLSNTRQIATSQHVLCLAATVPPQSNTNHTATCECVLLSCSWYDQTVQDMPVVMSQHVLFVAAGTTRLSKT